MSIQGIDAASVHRLTSGQVVTDLQTCVKELVENSLDAGATSIEVRFKQHGLGSIEVIDNGSGIAPADYDSVALKHYTSKLATFDDIASVRTFGFRGEALSSLCALCESVTVLTATEDEAPMGTVLEFDARGRVKSRSGKAARQRGTTVTLTKLFAPLPVRRKDLEKNAKREFGKALGLLQAYALVPCSKENGGVRFTVSNQLDVGGRKVQLQTKGNSSIQAAVTALWGPKAMENVVTLDIAFDVEAERGALKRLAPATRVQVKGLISKFMPGCGRQSSDRQYLFVNGRPCNLSKVQKAFNETYRLFNATQTPFVIADIILPTDTCDINVSPDKRTIFLHSESNLIVALKEGLENAFASSRSTYRINSGSSASQAPVRESDEEDEEEEQKEDEDEDDFDSDKPMSSGKPIPLPTRTNRTSMPSAVSVPSTSGDQTRRTDVNLVVSLPSTNVNISARTSPPPPLGDVPLFLPDEDVLLGQPDSTTQPPAERPPSPPPMVHAARSTTSLSPPPSREDPMSVDDTPAPAPPSSSTRPPSLGRPYKYNRVASPPPAVAKKGTLLAYFGAASSKTSNARAASPPAPVTPTRQSVERKRVRDDDFEEPRPALGRGGGPSPVAARLSKRFKALSPEPEPEPELELDAEELLEIELDELAADDDRVPEEVPARRTSSSSGRPTPASSRRTSTTSVIPSDADIIDLTDVLASPRKPTRASSAVGIGKVDADTALSAFVDLDSIISTWQASTACSNDDDDAEPEATSGNVDGVEADAEVAEETLSRIIHKADFSRMRILGQFNLGFIIARLRGDGEDGEEEDDDLFIIDQHASDEKYNFETLQETTKMETQRLLRPRPLELTAADELLAIERIDVLRKNGFDLEVDEDAPAHQRIKLTAIPVSKNTSFSVEDLEELIHLLRDSAPGQMARCSKVRAMFAMRACRKSVMIGDALNMRQMKEIVSHMGTMDQPWNCPHGRPTMRHLASLQHVQRTPPSTHIDWDTFMEHGL